MQKSRTNLANRQQWKIDGRKEVRGVRVKGDGGRLLRRYLRKKDAFAENDCFFEMVSPGALFFYVNIILRI